MSNIHESSMKTEQHGLLPLRRGVLLPEETTAVPVGRDESIALVKSVGAGGHLVVAVQRDPSVESPLLSDLHPVAVLAEVRSVTQDKSGGLKVVLEGKHRVRLLDLAQSQPFLQAQTVASDPGSRTQETVLLLEETRGYIRNLARELGFEVPPLLFHEEDPGRFADSLTRLLPLDPEHKVRVLLAEGAGERLRVALDFAKQAAELWSLRRKIGSEVRRELTKEQRRALLQQQLRAIRRELGEGGENEAVDALRERLEGIDAPQNVKEVIDRELARLESMGTNSPEHNVLRTYLELIADLPWTTRAGVEDDIDAVSARLEKDHDGLQEVKRRVLEHLAVARLSGDVQGTILCLVGPPGVGKTSLAQSVAAATGRPLVRVSLGGVRDEAELRGHRRTYVGALPGRIIAALRNAKVKNPVIVLDEIDKLGQGFWGSPEAALLEILDPEQNASFTDHYLEVPFDLSEVMFITTANTLETLSPPLRDRLEIIELSGYTSEEKVDIAKNHLVPKQLKRIGLTTEDVELREPALRQIIEDYTREAGVRQLDRQIAKLTRGIALEVARKPKDTPHAKVVIEVDRLRPLLGRPKHRQDVAERAALPGVATGLAWTPVGGDILFIEASRMHGTGKVTTTGKLGDVMQESAQAALSYVRSHADELGIDAKFLREQDIHIHVPAGGIPKDGPSAGITIFTALASLLTGRRVRSDTAMTGECSLRGRVLPVGGIRDKVAAARRAGLERVVLPRRNEPDLEDLQAEVKGSMEFILVDDMGEVLAAALEPLPVTDAAPLLTATGS